MRNKYNSCLEDIMMKLFEGLHLKDVGLLELLFSLTPLLSGFDLGSFSLSWLMWVFLIGVAILKYGKLPIKDFRPFTIFIIYWFLHTMIIIVVDNDEVNFNGIIGQAIYFSSVYVLFPSLNIDRLRGSLNFVMIIAIAGLLYQWGIILRGSLVHPLEIPGLTMPSERLYSLSLRPSSFFMEPAAYVAFAICPLFFALIKRQWLWSMIIILSMFLTTSTTGIALSFIMLGATLYADKFKSRNVVIVMILGVGLFYALYHYEIFSVGVEKIENTYVDTNVRLTQGRHIASTMHPEEYILGAPYSSPYHYCKDRGLTNDIQIDGETIFMSTIWFLILCYGIVGLVLYLHIYWCILKLNKKTVPMVACLVTVMFTSGYTIGVSYIFTLIFLLVFSNLQDDRSNYPCMYNIGR